jgi:hypothetical protein
LKKYVPEQTEGGPQKTSFVDSIKSGFRLIRHKPEMRYIFIAKALTSGTWSLALLIAFPLLIHQVTNGDVQSFGFVMASYGLGNFIGAIYFGSRIRRRLMLMLFGGYIWLGFGFIFTGIAPSIWQIMIAACFTGISGPMNDLAFIDLVQESYPVKELAKIFRLRIAVESAGTLVCTLISPWLIHMISVRNVIILCGVIWILVGAGGLVIVKDRRAL